MNLYKSIKKHCLLIPGLNFLDLQKVSLLQFRLFRHGQFVN